MSRSLLGLNPWIVLRRLHFYSPYLCFETFRTFLEPSLSKGNALDEPHINKRHTWIHRNIVRFVNWVWLLVGRVKGQVVIHKLTKCYPQHIHSRWCLLILRLVKEVITDFTSTGPRCINWYPIFFFKPPTGLAHVNVSPYFPGDS